MPKTTANPNATNNVSNNATTNKTHKPRAKPIETHPFAPVLTPNADVLMMGTFPPTSDKWGMTFHYPNFNNDMWRIYGAVFFDDKAHFRAMDEQGEPQKGFDADKICAFMSERGIASCPTVKRAIREQGNASDKFLTVVETVNLGEVLEQLPNLYAIFTTGGKATEVLLDMLPEDERPKLPKTNATIDYDFAGRHLTLTRLPSTSRAYPLKFEKKVEAYRAFFERVGKV